MDLGLQCSHIGFWVVLVFFYLQITFSTWFILKTFPADSFLFFHQNNNTPKSAQNLLF